jgi:predicted ATP-grasp superfamily ATP-dependent carboligase
VDGHLPPAQDGGFVTRRARASGKAIVFARRDVCVGDTRAWLKADLADVPHPGTRIARGRPVCTVFAEGADATACRDALVARAADVYRQLDQWNEEAA